MQFLFLPVHHLKIFLNIEVYVDVKMADESLGLFSHLFDPHFVATMPEVESVYCLLPARKLGFFI